MNTSEFQDGYLIYTCELKTLESVCADIDFTGWDDGYLAFSNKELRMREISAGIESLLQGDELGKVTTIDGVEGYLMEVDLWRGADNGFEEISLERGDEGILCSRWKLATHKPGEGIKYYPCRWRQVATFPRANSIFHNHELQSIEVIVPENRFHFFITKGKRV